MEGETPASGQTAGRTSGEPAGQPEGRPDAVRTLELLKMPRKPARRFAFPPPPIVPRPSGAPPRTVFAWLWLSGVPPGDGWSRSSNGRSPGSSKPDLYRSTASWQSCNAATAAAVTAACTARPQTDGRLTSRTAHTHTPFLGLVTPTSSIIYTFNYLFYFTRAKHARVS